MSSSLTLYAHWKRLTSNGLPTAPPFNQRYWSSHLARYWLVHHLCRFLVFCLFFVLPRRLARDSRRITVLFNSGKIPLMSGLLPDSWLRHACIRLVYLLEGIHMNAYPNPFSPKRETILGPFILLLYIREVEKNIVTAERKTVIKSLDSIYI